MDAKTREAAVRTMRYGAGLSEATARRVLAAQERRNAERAGWTEQDWLDYLKGAN